MRNERKEAVKELLRCEASRRILWQFCMYYDHEFFSKRPFLKDIADGFQAIEDKEIKSLAVSMPPRSGKSYITSLFCAWTIGRNPERSVMRNTCTSTLYQKFSYDVRAIVKSDKFKKVFSNVILSDDKSNLQGWNTNSSKQVGYFGAGVGGTIIGFGASNVAITDDLYRGIEDALSDTVNDRIIQWKESTHDSRFESGCARIDIGTRWSLNDVIGRNMEMGAYDRTVIVPAIDENGKSFCEDVMTTDEYQTIKKRMAPEIWEAEYMQTPVDMKGRLFNQLKHIDQSEFEAIKDKIEGCVGYIDVSDQGADYTALAICAVIQNELYIVDYLMTRDNTDITIPLCAEKLSKWKVTYCRVESNSMGAMFSRELQRNTGTRILQVHNTTNKMTRIIMQSAFIMSRFNFVRNGDNMSELFIQNILSFSKEGKNKNDDAPDCLAGLSIFVQSMFKNLS
ncbi:MAG: phage terminase large subunit [Flavobacteriales bacterium]|jgi:predicted phage terminase large subunit-like protein